MISAKVEAPLRWLTDSTFSLFERYGFKDVQVSVGVMSTDDKIMISATNGEIVDMLGQ